MIEDIILPSQISFIADKKEPKQKAQVVIEPLYPGYGETIGNSLRRVLLSSLPGFAVNAIKIQGVDHEFASAQHVKEDVIEIILNMKQLRFVVHSQEPVVLKLHAKGEKVVTAGDIENADNVEVINKDQIIATLTDKNATFDMEIFVDQGRGYVPVEQRDNQKLEVGMIAIDSLYTPVQKVSFKIDNIRVGQLTNFDKIIMDIETDGTVTPEIALKKSAKVLVDHYALLQGDLKTPDQIASTPAAQESVSGEQEEGISEMKFSTRTFNALQKNHISTMKDLVSRSESELLDLEGFGRTALEEVQKKLKKRGMELKQS